jgi:hypothetical protein
MCGSHTIRFHSLQSRQAFFHHCERSTPNVFSLIALFVPVLRSVHFRTLALPSYFSSAKRSTICHSAKIEI